MESLLAPEEAPAARILNPEGKADLLLICDHASRAVPKTLGDLGVPRAEWDRHIAFDIGAEPAARVLSERFDAPLVVSGYSRLVVDCNRRPEDPTAMPEIADGTPIPGNRDLPPAERARRLRDLHAPYHAAVAQAIAKYRTAGRVPIVVAMHSCTPVFKGFERPWHVGILWKSDPRLPVPLMKALADQPGVNVGDNQPYDARDGHGYTMRTHCEMAGIPHALIELRQDLVDTRAGVAEWAGIFGDALEVALRAPGLDRLEVYP
ncbi:MAG: N-formylglutamate amidohydrolase [Tagaea sp.]|nr:N-formylglutamate amidohydrolase [Tagaea sp.]